MKQALQHCPLQSWSAVAGFLGRATSHSCCRSLQSAPLPAPNFTQKQTWLLCCMQGFTTFSATALALTFVFGDSVKGVFEVTAVTRP